MLLITFPIFNLEFFESQNSQTRIKSDQKRVIYKKILIQIMVIMNTKEATAYFCRKVKLFNIAVMRNQHSN